jgi:DNA-binding NarL/FixJ family response regulator
MATDDELLDAVRAAAEAAVDAQVGDDQDPQAAGRLQAAARAALDGGVAISAIARAESDGERAARQRLGGQVLRVIERAAKKLRDVTAEYEDAVVKGVRIGLPARDIAGRAGVSHGTVTALARRHADSPTPPSGDAAPAGEHDDGGGASAASSAAV